MNNSKLKILTQILLSFSLLGAGIFILVHSPEESALSYVSAGWIGLIIGYWLR